MSAENNGSDNNGLPPLAERAQQIIVKLDEFKSAENIPLDVLKSLGYARVIEEQIKDNQALKENSLLNKYTLEETAQFIIDKFADLGKTFLESLEYSLEEAKALLGSIYPLGMTWNEKAISNQEIGLIYQAIRAFANGGVHVGDPNVSELEPDSRLSRAVEINYHS